ncbi:MAG: peptide-methionine (S)-S-oxide reductase MsrA [Isosphaeraceae bacterium]
MEAVFDRVKGVKRAVSGFAGGEVPNPSYEMVCTGLTGHAEAVHIEYDPKIVSFDDLLAIFWKSHDPTTLNAQGPDVGTQYRSVIFYHNDEQKAAALASAKKLADSGVLAGPIVTQLVPFTKFYPASADHQNYFRVNPYSSYSQTIIAPKLEALGALKSPAPAGSHHKKK